METHLSFCLYCRYMADTEAEIHGELYTRIKDCINKGASKYTEAHSEFNTKGGVADIVVEGDLINDLVIEVKKDDIYLLEDDNIVQARDYADDIGTNLFALVNSTNLFLFKYEGEVNIENIDFYYLNLTSYSSLNEAIDNLFKSLEFLYENDRLPRQEKREKIVAILRTFHSSVWPVYSSLAENKYGKDGRFTNRFEEWIDKNNYSERPREEQFDILSKQHAYLLANRVLFYEVLRENNVDDGYDVIMNRLDTIGESGVYDRLKNKFNRVVNKIDYEPILDNSDTVFEVFPENKKTQSLLQELLMSMSDKKIEEISEDLLGDLYEELIPETERKELGQFYTPPSIARAISIWACENIDDESKILDPASGSGTFSVEVYKQLKKFGYSHQKSIASIYSVDVNRFPLHLTALNLARQEIDQVVDDINTVHGSFFNLEEQMVDIRDNESLSNMSGYFDSVVGNPPYIGHSVLYPDKEHFRNHLSRLNTKKYYSGGQRISSRADSYIYFATNAVRLLDEGGRLGYIIPSKWLDTKYGKNFKAFLDEETRIQSVIGFKSRVFEDAEVDTCILLAEKSNKNKKENNVDFIKIKDDMDPEDLISTVKYTQDVQNEFAVDERQSYRIVSIPQNELFKNGYETKLGYILRAPTKAIETVRNIGNSKLSDFADIEQGSPTGANDFFYIDESEVKKWNIEERFITKSLKNLKRVGDDNCIRDSDSDRYVLDMNTFVEETKSGEYEGKKIEDKVKNRLEYEGYNGVLRYIDYGESEEFHRMSKPSKKDVWFNLGTISTPSMIHPKSYNENIRVIRSENLRISDRLKGISVKEDVNGQLLFMYLNSELYKITVECFGRREGGGSLEIMTYELREMPIPDLKNIDTSWFDKNMSQEEFDRQILPEVGIDLSLEKIQNIRKIMTKERVGMNEEVRNLLSQTPEINSGFINEDEFENQ